MDNRFAELDMGQPIEVEKPAKIEKPKASTTKPLDQQSVTEPLSIADAARIVDQRMRNRQVQNEFEEFMRAQQRMAEQAARERAIPMMPPRGWGDPYANVERPPWGNAHGLWRDERDRGYRTSDGKFISDIDVAMGGSSAIHAGSFGCAQQNMQVKLCQA
jgi:hypothetical protein